MVLDHLTTITNYMPHQRKESAKFDNKLSLEALLRKCNKEVYAKLVTSNIVELADNCVGVIWARDD